MHASFIESPSTTLMLAMTYFWNVGRDREPPESWYLDFTLCERAASRGQLAFYITEFGTEEQDQASIGRIRAIETLSANGERQRRCCLAVDSKLESTMQEA